MAVCDEKQAWGVGLVLVQDHGSGAGYDASGEVLPETLLAALDENLGPNTASHELVNSPTVNRVNVQQRTFAMGEYIPKSEATFTSTFFCSTAEDWGNALGVDPRAVNIGGENYKVVGPTDYPKAVSLMAQLDNPEDSSEPDLLYLPNARASQELTILFGDEVRVAATPFVLLGSCQDSMLDQAFLFMKEAELTGVLVQKTAQASSATWEEDHNFNLRDVAMISENDEATPEVIYGDARTPNGGHSVTDFSLADAGDSTVFAAGVDVDDAPTGLSEVQRVDTPATTWTITAREFAYVSPMYIMVLDENYRVLPFTDITITAGAIGAGTVVINFSEAIAGRVLIIKEGPTGETTQGYVGLAQWIITGPTPTQICGVQAYDTSGQIIYPSITRQAGDPATYHLDFDAVESGDAILIH